MGALPGIPCDTLKAYYGNRATAQNDFGYGWLPKITGNHSFFEYLYDMLDEKMEGMFLMGENRQSARPIHGSSEKRCRN